ncbi:hypothetical protein FNH08_01465 [Streptomyces spongiae]|uniref:Dihydroxy-acid/6-phosphogluconate dehydratase N-terminal domain-containing protein n=1 Tax=Streptomyces spongiae TaxID=565072 RepID=A0A5N8X9N3_9ACTN|nr:hypothetical protein [Streptomyces spongiae]
MAGARALMRLRRGQRRHRKPITAVANSFTECRRPDRLRGDQGSRCVTREFSTTTVDDGIAMGHGGMLCSLPSRDLTSPCQAGALHHLPHRPATQPYLIGRAGKQPDVREPSH